MNRYVLAAIAVLMILGGCEYNPYYDGQILRVYQTEYGLIETDGVHLNVPILSHRPYILEVYGGKGKSHKISVSDPELLTYTYKKASVETFLGEGIEPASLTLQPQQLGDTSIEILDEDTGESININLHIVKAYNMMEIYDSHNSLTAGTVIAFDYPSSSEDIKMCRKNQENGNLEYLFDAKCRFHDCDTTVMMELTYLADECEQPDIHGTEITKKYLVQFEEGYTTGESYYTLYLMNLSYMTIHTRAVKDDFDIYEYNERFRFIDITDNENPDPESPKTKIFYARSARLQPWIE
jgi:hypothetical protein